MTNSDYNDQYEHSILIQRSFLKSNLKSKHIKLRTIELLNG